MAIRLYDYQENALNRLKTGSILYGRVGSGKSLTALTYYYVKECDGILQTDTTDLTEMNSPKDLYIITTARKRDTLEWDKECANFRLSNRKRDISISNVLLVIDSWNNIAKYSDVKNAFFIFDEQRVIGSGTWVKHFLKIVKLNNWILLTATPGDTWSDYIPVFVANGFYKNRTEFIRRHIVFSRVTKFPKIDRYVDVGYLHKLKEKVLVEMNYKREIATNIIVIPSQYNKELYKASFTKRWDPFKNQPVRDAGALCYLLRKIVNSDMSRLEQLESIFKTHKKVIIFYNFNYELEILRTISKVYPSVVVSEYNGHKHESIPNNVSWAYLVQYASGSEGWNCVETNTVVFYSQNYSYRTMIQAAGRVDRLNTPYQELFYYHFQSDAPIDVAIARALRNKKNFNKNKFLPKYLLKGDYHENKTTNR